jgi:hypothetical protein
MIHSTYLLFKSEWARANQVHYEPHLVSGLCVVQNNYVGAWTAIEIQALMREVLWKVESSCN